MEGLIFYFTNPLNLALAAALQNPSPLLGSLSFFWFVLAHGGWVVLAIFAFLALKFAWIDYIQTKFAQARQWTVLAIDVPRDNVQSPKGVENIFAHLAGAHSNPDLVDSYWKGTTQDYFSFEIVGIEGYVQFIIRTPTRYRDLVEASIYSQYPEAQITEIEDYTTGFPSKYPDETYDVYGTEFIQVQDQAYPIRTYPEFEHVMTQEYKDPLTTLLETYNKLGPGEQIWLQYIVVPTGEEWKRAASDLIKRIMNIPKKSSGPTVFGGLAGEAGKIASEAQSQVFGLPSGEAAKNDRQQNTLLIMPPDDKARVEGIGNKIKKIGFLTKIRLIYVARKENFQAAHGREAVVGAIKQTNAGDVNSLKPDVKIVGVHAHYVLIEYRKNLKKNKLMMRYKARSHYGGRKTFILNTEELATLWHFPLKTETSPIRHMVQRTEFRHTPPPPRLPTVDELDRPVPPPLKNSEEKTVSAEPPVNLPSA